ncbi:hypothetical protein DPMN_022229 [Dreissena polymorpha]|uniref:Uncharacterized protein n=1 Tax=Dreissena polymorpha TaxID=45954 RepID=A0A9D4NQ98_DREPO|nr:hypothetical protein DPMN_022229 [Dreissena polymorpha]
MLSGQLGPDAQGHLLAQDLGTNRDKTTSSIRGLILTSSSPVSDVHIIKLCISKETWIAKRRDPQSVIIMQSEPQMPFDEIKPSNQKHSLLQQERERGRERERERERGERERERGREGMRGGREREREREEREREGERERERERGRERGREREREGERGERGRGGEGGGGGEREGEGEGEREREREGGRRERERLFKQCKKVYLIP